MAISEVCKFEVKEELDRLCQGKGISRNEASRELSVFYKEVVGVDVNWQTIKKKDQRARQVGTNVPAHGSIAEITRAVVALRRTNNALQSAELYLPREKSCNGCKGLDANNGLCPAPRSQEWEDTTDRLIEQVQAASTGEWPAGLHLESVLVAANILVKAVEEELKRRIKHSKTATPYLEVIQ